ncbi:MAG: GAP family protein [Oscillochloridaceae bacterium umkhey_bin13]
MDSLFTQLIPLILGAVLSPLWVIIVLLMLTSPGGVLKATAFVLGMSFTRVVQGLLFGFVFGAATQADESSGKPIVSTLLLLMGILLLVAGVRKWRKEDDPDEPPPKWMQSMNEITALKAFGMGALLVGIGPKLWVFTLSALAVISDADLGLTASSIAFAFYIVMAQIVLILAILVAVLIPKRSQAILARAMDWLNTYNRPISITVALVFGVFFMVNGLQGLLE